MLENQPDKGTPYAGWSSAMSVLSVLLQLQSFLSDEKLQYVAGVGTMAQALAKMDAFVCTGCAHQGTAAPRRHRAT